MNNIKISIETVNTNKVAAILLSMLANLDLNYGKVSLSKHDKIGVVLNIYEVETDSATYDELVDVLRDMRKLDSLYRDRIEATLQVDVWWREYEYSYFYDNDWCGNIIFEESGDLHMDDDNDNDNDE